MVKIFYPTIGWWLTWGIIVVHSMLYSRSQAPDCSAFECDLDCDRGFIKDSKGCSVCFCIPEIETPGEVELKAGENRELYCTVVGVENSSVVQWHQDDNVFFSAGGYDTDQDGKDDVVVYDNNTLWIVDANDANAGLYTCVVHIEVDGRKFNVTAEFRVSFNAGKVNRGGDHQKTDIPVAASASAISLIVVLLAIVAWYFLVRKQLLKDAEKDRVQRRHSSRRHGSRHGHRSSRHGSVRGESSRQGSMKNKCGQMKQDIENGGLTDQQNLVEPCTCSHISANVYDETSHGNKAHPSAKIHPSPEPQVDDDLSPNPSRHSSVSRKSRYSSVAGDESPMIHRHGSKKVNRSEFSPQSSPRLHHHSCHGDHLYDSPRIKRHSSRKKHPREAFIEDSPSLRRKESRKSHRTSSNASEKGARTRTSTFIENCPCHSCPDCQIQRHHHHHQTSPPPVPVDLLPVAASDITVETIDGV
ncbi:uncharacterized protein [Ptychodera flava]|uniref:uncharacterized protein n=1 Tax=Ptychodera flava TaxID=63121 RepID=UPI00396A6481